MSEGAKKRPGRPRAAAPLVPVTSMVPKSTYDRLCQQAHDNRVNLSKFVRILLNGAAGRDQK